MEREQFDKNAFDDTKVFFVNANKKNADKENIAYEMAIAAVMLRFNTGVTLFKQDIDGTFKPIVVKTIKSLNKKGKEVFTYTIDCSTQLIP